MTTGIFIQARLGSTRLPGKCLLPVGKDAVPVLGMAIGRLMACQQPNAIVVLTTTYSRDDALCDYARRLCPVYRGPEDDVLRRFLGAAIEIEGNGNGTRARGRYDAIVRVTADCPLVDPAVVDAMVAEFSRRLGLDYLSNCHPERTVPKGFDVEIVSFSALVRAHGNATNAYDREHVTAYIHGRVPERFAIATWRPDVPVRTDLPNLSVDTREDYERVCRVVDALGPAASMAEIAAWTAAHEVTACAP